MNNQLPQYFVDWKPKLPSVCTRYEIRSPVFHMPLIQHKFAENLLRYCLIMQLNMEKCSVLITSKVHTHSFLDYKIYLKQKAINLYSDHCTMLCLQKIKSVSIDSFSFNLLTLFYCDVRYTRILFTHFGY